MNVNQYKDKEIWMQIKTESSGYEISNHGRVKLKNSITYGYVIGKYLGVSLPNKHYKVHRLVALHFIPNYNKEKIEVDHIDENKQNNHYLNLQWLTGKENIIKSLGVSAIQTDLNGTFIEKFTNSSNIQDISHSNISAVIAGRRFSTGGYLWFSELQYKDENFIKEKVNRNKRKYNIDRKKNIDYSILKINKNTNKIVEKINSLTQYESDKIKRNNIITCCSDFRKKTAYGFKWKFWDKNKNEE